MDLSVCFDPGFNHFFFFFLWQRFIVARDMEGSAHRWISGVGGPESLAGPLFHLSWVVAWVRVFPMSQLLLRKNEDGNDWRLREIFSIILHIDVHLSAFDCIRSISAYLNIAALGWFRLLSKRSISGRGSNDFGLSQHRGMRAWWRHLVCSVLFQRF